MLGLEKSTLKVDGMTCAHCTTRITSALNELEGISKVKTNLKNQTVTFSHKKETDLSVVENKLKEMGYKITK